MEGAIMIPKYATKKAEFDRLNKNGFEPDF